MKNPLNNIKDKIIHYLNLRFQLIKLEIAERVGNIMGYFVFLILSIFFFFITIFFVGFGLAAWFTQLLDSAIAGYFITAGIMLIGAVTMVLLSKKIIRFFGDKAVWLLSQQRRKSEDDDEEEED